MIHNWEPKPNTNIHQKRIRKAKRKIDWDPVRDPAQEVALAREAQGDHGPTGPALGLRELTIFVAPFAIRDLNF